MDLLFNDIEVVKLPDGPHVPTAVRYLSSEKAKIGIPAREGALSVNELNRGFKMHLGMEGARIKYPRQYRTGVRDLYKTAREITGDFLETLLEDVQASLDNSRSNTRLIVAEPIAMQGELLEKNWLRNYRKHIRDIVEESGYEHIDFLPEPFAVYQYYRYGTHSKDLIDNQEYNVLVVDFGGGTLDTCIINTTKSGDISGGGINSRPIAAHSTPVGGYYINREIAINTYFNVFDSDNRNRKRFIDCLRVYRRYIKGEIKKVDSLKDYLTDFIYTMEDVVYGIETEKLALSSQIFDWSTEADLSSVRVPVSLPRLPWEPSEGYIETWVHANDLRDVFINKVWSNHVRPSIESTVERGKQDLSGQQIDVVLLSGGTCNLKWLKILIERDLREQIDYASILTLSNYRDVVAQGLAIECARQFYTESSKGDFADTTYNSVCLLLDPRRNGESFNVQSFTSVTEGLEDVSDKPGTLIPPATDLSGHLNKPLRWHLRFSKKPNQRLDYLFLRSTLDYTDTSAWLNVQERFLETPSDFRSFDNRTTVELHINEGGEATPSFIYQKGNDYVDEVRVTGLPFILDMTDLKGGWDQKASYLGVDFGTTNTSVSHINDSSIAEFNKRRHEEGFAKLQSLKNTLPFPIAYPLANWLSSPPGERDKRALHLFESCLSFLIAVCYTSYCTTNEDLTSKLFKSYPQASVGPSWGLLKILLEKQSGNSFTQPLIRILSPETKAIIDKAVDDLNSSKHRKINAVEVTDAVERLLYCTSSFFSNKCFGFFRTVQKVPGPSKEYEGVFTEAHGHNSPFVETYRYRGREDFSVHDPVIFDKDNFIAFKLTPILFWKTCQKHTSLDQGHCYIFDKVRKDTGDVDFVTVLPEYDCASTFSPEDPDRSVQSIASWINEIKKRDLPIPAIDEISDFSRE
jgi:hypothetical protein